MKTTVAWRLFVLVSFYILLFLARLSLLNYLESTLNSLSYRIVSYRNT